MPLQNRVGPNGEIFASPARGTFFGNRGGVMHNDDRQLVRPYAGRRWLICLLSFKDRRRTVMSPGLYTELFFLDEAVALAAGHRPCAECRRDRFNAFKNAWLAAGNPRGDGPAIVDIMDRELHRTRIGTRKEAPLHSLTVASSASTPTAICFTPANSLDGRPKAIARRSISRRTQQ